MKNNYTSNDVSWAFDDEPVLYNFNDFSQLNGFNPTGSSDISFVFTVSAEHPFSSDLSTSDINIVLGEKGTITLQSKTAIGIEPIYNFEFTSTADEITRYTFSISAEDISDYAGNPGVADISFEWIYKYQDPKVIKMSATDNSGEPIESGKIISDLSFNFYVETNEATTNLEAEDITITTQPVGFNFTEHGFRFVNSTQNENGQVNRIHHFIFDISNVSNTSSFEFKIDADKFDTEDISNISNTDISFSITHQIMPHIRAPLGEDFTLSSTENIQMVIEDGSPLPEICVSGNLVGIHTSNPQEKLDVSGNMHVSNNITADGVITSLSDARFKTDITTITNALEKVKALRGVYYNYNPQYISNDERQIGVIANEVEQVIPEVVHTEKNAMQWKAVSYGQMNALLLEAVKELDTLQTQVQANLEGQLYAAQMNGNILLDDVFLQSLNVDASAIQISNGITIHSESTNNVNIYTRAEGNISSDNSGEGICISNNMVGIGTRNPRETLDVSGNIHVSGNLTALGRINAFSDEKIKTNIQTIANALEKVKQMRGVYYKRTDTVRYPPLEMGFIAQEVEPLFPGLVMTGHSEEERKSVAYGNMVAVLIEALKTIYEKALLIERGQYFLRPR